jgi:hypothetical protein
MLRKLHRFHLPAHNDLALQLLATNKGNAEVGTVDQAGTIKGKNGLPYNAFFASN